MVLLRSCSFVALVCVAHFASTPDISITGTVKSGDTALKEAVVSLVSDAKIADTTDAAGAFTLSTGTAIQTPFNLHLQNAAVGISGTQLCFSLPFDAATGEVTLFSGNGRNVARIPATDLTAGTNQVALPKLRPGFYVMTVAVGNFSVTRKLIATGIAMYLNGSDAVSAQGDEAVYAKSIQTSADQIKVVKDGYVTKLVDITGYQVKDLEIVLEKSSGGGPCVGGAWGTADVSKAGPFETKTENVEDAVLYRPKDMVTGCIYPVITWGHGAGGSPSNYTTVLNMMASHGFVIIASTAGNVQDGGNSQNQFRNKMVQVAEWVVKQNSNSASVLYQKIDTAKIGASGHSQGGYGASEAGQNPLIKTSVSISGAVGSPNQKGPAFIICGGKDTYSGARCEDHPTDAYNGTNNVPIFFGKCLSADHVNWGFEMMLSDKTTPHDVVQATIAWFRYHLMGDVEYRTWFYGPSCKLCTDSNWEVKRKKIE